MPYHSTGGIASSVSTYRLPSRIGGSDETAGALIASPNVYVSVILVLEHCAKLNGTYCSRSKCFWKHFDSNIGHIGIEVNNGVEGEKSQNAFNLYEVGT